MTSVFPKDQLGVFIAKNEESSRQTFRSRNNVDELPFEEEDMGRSAPAGIERIPWPAAIEKLKTVLCEPRAGTVA